MFPETIRLYEVAGNGKLRPMEVGTGAEFVDILFHTACRKCLDDRDRETAI